MGPGIGCRPRSPPKIERFSVSRASVCGECLCCVVVSSRPGVNTKDRLAAGASCFLLIQGYSVFLIGWFVLTFPRFLPKSHEPWPSFLAYLGILQYLYCDTGNPVSALRDGERERKRY